MSINPQAKLKEGILDITKIEQKPTRDGYGAGLVKAGEENPNVVVLCADLTDSTRSQGFKDKFPERFIEAGIAEQNMASVAAGLAATGKVPFISSYAAFSPGRNWEQIRTTICYNERNVKIAGAHAGISVGPDGATHQAIEDIATMRVLANMMVIVPCDAIEAEKATIAAIGIDGPVYLRFAREKTPVITTAETPFEIGKAQKFWESEKPQVAIISCGPLTHNALLAAAELEKEGIGSIVLNIHTVKPLDESAVIEAAKVCGAAVTVEEHQIVGGLGGAVSETLAKHFPTPMEFVGVENRFGESGEPAELIKHFGMAPEHIVAAAKIVIAKKIK